MAEPMSDAAMSCGQASNYHLAFRSLLTMIMKNWPNSHLDKVLLLVSELAPLGRLPHRRSADSRFPARPTGHRRRPSGGVARVADGVHVDAAGDRREDVGLARGDLLRLTPVRIRTRPEGVGTASSETMGRVNSRPRRFPSQIMHSYLNFSTMGDILEAPPPPPGLSLQVAT